MTPKERVRQSIRHRSTDKIPKGELCIDDRLIAEFFGAGTVDFDCRRAFIDRLGLDLVCLPTCYGKEGAMRRLPEPGRVIWEELDLWVRKTGRFIFVLLDGGFSWGIRLLGFEKFLVAVSRRSQQAVEIFKRVCHLNISLIRIAADMGVEGVVIADDIAYAGGPLIDPAILRERFFPLLKHLSDKCRDLRLFPFFHSDGDLRRLLPDLIDCGMEGLQCIESAAHMDLASIRESYGERLCLWGNLDPAVLSQPMAEEAIKRQVAQVFASGGTSGGFIFGTSSGLYQGMLRRNIEIAYADP